MYIRMRICVNNFEGTDLEDLIDESSLYVASFEDSDFETITVYLPCYEKVCTKDYLECINLKHPVLTVRHIIETWKSSAARAKKQWAKTNTILLDGSDILYLLQRDSAPTIILVMYR